MRSRRPIFQSKVVNICTKSKGTYNKNDQQITINDIELISNGFWNFYYKICKHIRKFLQFLKDFECNSKVHASNSDF